MKNLYLLGGVSFVLIAVTTVVEGVYMKDRWGKPGAAAAELGKRFAQVPTKIGSWTGIDNPVTKEVQERSGAVSFVNRRYTDEVTDKSVDVWLIIGHSRDIIRHTPDICYPASGFHPLSSKLRHTIEYGDDKEGDFYTGEFQKEDSLTRQTQRVYWAWNHPKEKKWEAPESPRFHFGMSTRALYKLYFTSAVTAEEKTVKDNAAVDFAELMLPKIDAALFPESTEAPAPALQPAENSESEAAVETEDDLPSEKEE